MLDAAALFLKKYWTHHTQKYVNDVSNFFICDFQGSDFTLPHIKNKFSFSGGASPSPTDKIANKNARPQKITVERIF